MMGVGHCTSLIGYASLRVYRLFVEKIDPVGGGE